MIHSSIVTSSIWSLSNSFSYCLLGIFRGRSAVSAPLLPAAASVFSAEGFALPAASFAVFPFFDLPMSASPEVRVPIASAFRV